MKPVLPKSWRWEGERSGRVVIGGEDKKVVKIGRYTVRTDDEACAIKRIHVIGDTVLLLSDSPEFPLVLAPATDLVELIIASEPVQWS